MKEPEVQDGVDSGKHMAEVQDVEGAVGAGKLHQFRLQGLFQGGRGPVQSIAKLQGWHHTQALLHT